VISLLFDIFGLAALAALATALVVAWIGRRLAPPDHRGAVVLPVAVAAGYFAGYAALPRSWAALVPQPNQAWQWLPYLGLLAGAISSLTHSFPKSSTWRLAVWAVAPVVAAALAPTWAVYGLSWQVLIGLIVVYLLVVGIPLQHLPARLFNLYFLGVLTAAAMLLALVTGAIQSVTLARLAAIAAGALAGTTMACAVGRKPTDLSVRSLVPVFVALVGGTAVVVAVEPDPPQTGLLAIGLLPLAMWLMVAIPNRKGRMTV
jgi:hypothetical protein